MHDMHVSPSRRRDRRNPKYMACMLDEDFMGHVIRTAHVAHRRTMTSSTVWRYAFQMTRRWRRGVTARL